MHTLFELCQAWDCDHFPEEPVTVPGGQFSVQVKAEPLHKPVSLSLRPEMVTNYLAGPLERCGRSILVFLQDFKSRLNKDEVMMAKTVPLQELNRSWYCSLSLQTDNGL